MREEPAAAPTCLGTDESGYHRPEVAGIQFWQLIGVYSVVAVLHIIGWGLFLYYSSHHVLLFGLGLTAYLFGLRHAFDADHIAAVDDMIRFMLQQGRRPLGVGLFFSLGHSTIVFALAIGIPFAAGALKQKLPLLQSYGGVIGAGISGAFLWIVGVLNLIVLLGLIGVWRKVRGTGHHDHTHVEELLAKRGFLSRILGVGARRFIRHSWQVYPIGLLFGLGFDTASEVALLAITATASVANVPVPAVFSLPIVFAAGMSILDTTDGVLMSRAYQWAFVNPARKLHYNLGMTGLSAFVALGIGGVELLNVVGSALHLRGTLFTLLDGLGPMRVGCAVIGLFLAGWGFSWGWWRWRHRRDPQPAPTTHAHVHTHPSGMTHIHRHYH